MLQFAKHKEMSLLLTALTHAATDIFSSFSTSRVMASGTRKEENPVPSADIYGTIDLTGNTFGKVEIALDRNMARQLAANIGQCDPDRLSDDEIYDGVGEIINQIAGNTRTKLWERGYKTEISIPVVTPKSNLAESGEKNKQTIYIIDFDCASGFVALQICLRLTKTKPMPVAQS